MTPSEIKALRTRLGLSQARVASLVGVDRNTWNRWEMGTLRPHPLRIPLLRELALRPVMPPSEAPR